tara:strand:+ start:186 stop:728 length:543 start_codon:yes stop_codon:yes gene_type:complete
MNLEKNKINQIFLIGQSGSGKTTIGKKLSKNLSFDYLDTDEYIEKKLNLTISEIFQKKGEPFFRSNEKDLVQELSLSKKIVISTGGGLPENEDTFNLMKINGFIIWIKSSPKEIEKRLIGSNRNHRPLLFNNNLKLIENLEAQLKKRYDVYSKADLIINNDNINENEATNLIEKELTNYG